MAKNICPNCKEVILGFGGEVIISCIKCSTVFKTVDSTDIINTICPRCFKIFEVPETLKEVTCPHCLYTYKLSKLIPVKKPIFL